METAPKLLHVDIYSWMIQDGAYDDFGVGDVSRFALDFHPKSFGVTPEGAQSIEHVDAARYRVRGEIVFASGRVTVLDFGWMAYSEGWRGKPELNVGDWIQSELYLGVDPHMWAAWHRNLPGMPELRYDFRIASIALERTPWLTTHEPRGLVRMTRDESREAYVSVERTDAWHDDDGHAHYVLECERIPPSGP